MPTTPALRMTHISKTYGTGSSQVQALRDVSLSIERGTLTLILGPSGSGKSTFLTIAGGLQTPDSGEISIDGQPMNALSKRAQDRLRLENIGFILQGHDLVPYLTVMEQFQLVDRVKPKGNISKNELLQLLKDLGVNQLANSLPRDMSGGQQQRVAIARALYTKPSLVLADEPTSALDSHSVEVVGELLRSVAHSQNTAMVVVTHDTRLVTLADDVYDMEDGVLTHRER